MRRKSRKILFLTAGRKADDKRKERAVSGGPSLVSEAAFSEDSHIVKAYRKRFNVDKDCAMHELCMLGLLPLEKQKLYEVQLAAKI